MSDDLVQQIALEGEDQVTGSLQSIGDTGESAFDKLAKAAESAAEHLGAIEAAAKRLHISYDEMAGKVQAASSAVEQSASASAQAAQSTETHTTAMGALDQALEKLTGSLGQVGGGFGQLISGLQSAAEHALGLESALGKLAFRAAEVVGGLGFLAQHASKAAQELIHHADAIGVSVGEYEKLQYAAGQTGTKMGSVTRALREIATASETALKEGFNSSGKFADQNLVLINSVGKARPYLDVLADAFDHANKSGNVAADLMKTFNKRTGGELTQWAKLGADGVEALNQRFERLHLHTSDDALQDGRKLYAEFENVSAAASSMGEKFGLALAPGFTPVVSALADALGALTPVVTALATALGGGLKLALEGVALPLRAVSTLANAGNTLFDKFASQAGNVGQSLKEAFPTITKYAVAVNDWLIAQEKKAGFHQESQSEKERKAAEAEATSKAKEAKEEKYAHAVEGVVKAENKQQESAEDSARAVSKAYRSQSETVEDVGRTVARSQRSEQEGSEDVERNIFRTKRAADETVEDTERGLTKSAENLQKLTSRGPDLSGARSAAQAGQEQSEALGAQIDAIDEGSPFGQQTKKGRAAAKKKEALEAQKARAEQKAAEAEAKAEQQALEQYKEKKEAAEDALADQERSAFRTERGAAESVGDAERTGYRTLRGLRESREDAERSGGRSVRNAGEGVDDALRQQERTARSMQEALDTAQEHLQKASERTPGSKSEARNTNAAVAQTGKAAAIGLDATAKAAAEAAEALGSLTGDQTYGEQGAESPGAGAGWGAGFAEGTNSVPFTGPAMVHAGEMIIPAGPASAFRNIMAAAGSALDFPALGASSVTSRASSPGAPSSMGTVMLNLGEGGSHSLLAPADVFRSIHGYAMRQQIKSAGRSQRAVR